MEEGLTIALTPAQLIALLTDGTIDGRPSGWTRVFGGLTLVFGGLEAVGAGALILAPEPTMEPPFRNFGHG